MLVLFFLPWVAFAETIHTTYEPSSDLSHQWAKVGSICLAITAGGLILYNLIARRNRMGEPSTRWMLFLATTLMPLPVLLLSGAVGIEQSKTVEFCGSCHVMEPFVNNMRDPESDLLAAIHFKQRYIQRDHCYKCHSDYGFLGDIEAKSAGMSHGCKNITGTYKMPIRINRPYNYTICLNCHGQAQKFLQEDLHEGVIDEVLRGETGCLDCHVASHPGREGEDDLMEDEDEDESEDGSDSEDEEATGEEDETALPEEEL
jgi:nitrate/TMAO reductase-like tetraheme cytochrome c subunit